MKKVINVPVIAKNITICVMLLVCLLGVQQMFTPMANDDNFDASVQSIDEVISRVNDMNFPTLMEGVDFEKSSAIPPCQPQEFVQSYLKLDPGYSEYLANYFGVTIA